MQPEDNKVPLLSDQDSDEDVAYDSGEKVHIVGINEPDDEASLGVVPPFSWKKLWLFTGPGFLISIAFLDLGNLEGDLQAGAIAGYFLLWLLMWATAMGLLVQLLAARLGVATGKHLAELCSEEYPTWARMVLWEVIGSAIAIKILSNGALPLWAGVLITAGDCFIFLFLENYGVRKLEAFLLSLLQQWPSHLLGCSVKQNQVASSFFTFTELKWFHIFTCVLVPKLSSKTIKQAVGVVGCIIMAHNLFLHSALVQSREIDRNKKGQASILKKNMEAGHSPFLYIWAMGLLAAGQSSTITGTYAGQFIMGGFLKLKLKKWVRALITRSCAIIPTILVALVFDSSEAALDTLNEWLNVLQSIQIPFALIPLLCLVSKEQIMVAFRIGHILSMKNSPCLRFPLSSADSGMDCGSAGDRDQRAFIVYLDSRGFSTFDTP
ncbi:hypothetical protein CXB51_031210 [Gossypium anomalum]|uniref:Uncharacterized protein n=1 Tax=Gossypium anomalum TaxID=47600 RepID=A0A8J5YBP4_9ROSI|nr:hypothetical protein CXB51_031210 [Gossypium anomalum]